MHHAILQNNIFGNKLGVDIDFHSTSHLETLLIPRRQFLWNIFFLVIQIQREFREHLFEMEIGFH